MPPLYFTTQAKFHQWLKQNHAKSTKLLVGFYKVNSGKPSITYQEALDEALCFGWIDGIRKSVDEERYTIRFTPRKPTSNWSNVNIKRMQELIAAGRVLPAGLAVFETRQPEKSGVYTYENRHQPLSPEYEKRLRANPQAWEYFQAQAPHYRHTVCGWVMTAKKEETRLRRLTTLIEDSAQGRWVAVMQVSKKK